jgi:basic membrane lipoprotein Med (substrate-binding protein (PBP1-ABC) superfamily)
MRNKRRTIYILFTIITLLVIACRSAESEIAAEILKVSVVLETGGENDRSFNQYSLEGARSAAEELGLEFDYIASATPDDYERNTANMAANGADLILTVGFRFGDATAKVARANPDVHFAIVDSAYFPGQGCAEDVTDCYTEEGGLPNVTSLMFAEDEVGYLAGVLAACMSQSGVIATVAGLEIPPVVRYVTGFQTGARSINPDITTLNQHIPDFNDPATGKVVGQEFIGQGADVIFGVGGNTGNGGLLAAHEAGHMAIGVDVDQYFTYPDVQASLLTSAAKNVDVAVAAAVEQFVHGALAGGIQVASLTNGGVGLAPYHDWADKIPASCQEQVSAEQTALEADPSLAQGE